MCSSPSPFLGLRRRSRCSKDWPVSGYRTARASGDHWLPCRTSEADHPCKNLEGKVWLEAANGETLRQERVLCAMCVGGSTVIGTAGDGWCTLGDRFNIGDAVTERCGLSIRACCGGETSLQMVVSPEA